MTPSVFHEAPRRSIVSQMFWVGPPSGWTFLSFPPAKKPIHWLSADQNTRPAPSVPGRTFATSMPIGRTKSAVDEPSRAENAIHRPSDEIDAAAGSGISGTLIRKRVSSRGSALRPVRSTHEEADATRTVIAAIAT